jgi:hypothetical protein
MSKQQNDFYVALRQETENKVKAVQEFEKQIASNTADCKRKNKSLANDIKLISKQIELNNKMLVANGEKAVSTD